MKTFGLFGGDFKHDGSSTFGKLPEQMQWEYGVKHEINCFCDADIVSNIKTPDRKFAWLVESSAIIPSIVESVKRNYKAISENYEFLISHDQSVISLADNFYYMPPHGYLIQEPKIYNKSKLVSMISSNKRYCEGHNFRMDWVEKLRDKVDLFGKGINHIDKKEVALCDYMFSVVIENSQYETYWSEKILDAFVTGTIPIYHGSRDIGNFFNMNGIIILTPDFDVSKLSEELYRNAKDAIQDNFERALHYYTTEDLIVERFFK